MSEKEKRVSKPSHNDDSCHVYPGLDEENVAKKAKFEAKTVAKDNKSKSKDPLELKKTSHAQYFKTLLITQINYRFRNEVAIDLNVANTIDQSFYTTQFGILREFGKSPDGVNKNGEEKFKYVIQLACASKSLETRKSALEAVETELTCWLPIFFKENKKFLEKIVNERIQLLKQKSVVNPFKNQNLKDFTKSSEKKEIESLELSISPIPKFETIFDEIESQEFLNHKQILKEKVALSQEDFDQMKNHQEDMVNEIQKIKNQLKLKSVEFDASKVTENRATEQLMNIYEEISELKLANEDSSENDVLFSFEQKYNKTALAVEFKKSILAAVEKQDFKQINSNIEQLQQNIAKVEIVYGEMKEVLSLLHRRVAKCKKDVEEKEKKERQKEEEKVKKALNILENIDD